jgi:hypothetical protein
LYEAVLLYTIKEMRKTASIVILLLLFIFLSAPLYASAQVDTILGGPLVQCGWGDYPACNLCELRNLAARVLNFLVALTVVAATVMFTWAGILYVTAGPNPGNIEKAHKIFWNVLIGLVAVLIAWLVIDTIMKKLVEEGEQGSEFGPWNEILCEGAGGGEGGEGGSGDEGGEEETGGSLGVVIAGSNTFIEDQQRQLFSSLGISVNNPKMCRECTIDQAYGVESECHDIRYQDYEAKYGQRCTSVDNMQIDTYDAIYDMREGSGCPLLITGGNELGHEEDQYSHRSGYKVDIGKDGCFDAYIKTNFEEGIVIDGREGYVIDKEIIPPGNAYIKVYAVDELDHWDVIVVEYNCLLEPLPGADRCFERKQP